MDARIKRLFFRGKSLSNSDLKGYSYDKTIPSKPPFRGSLPISGNGQNGIAATQEYQAKQSRISDSSTEETNIPESRQFDANLSRPQSRHYPGTTVATESGRTKSSGRTFSSLSIDSPSSLRSSKHRTSPPSTKSVKAVRPVVEAYVPRIPESTTQHTKHKRAHSTHVDIIQASSLKQHASGKRDYGEDVADRNIGEQLNPDLESNFNFSSPEFNYMRTTYLQHKGVADRNKSKEHLRVESTLEHVNSIDGSLPPIPVVTKISSDGRPKLQTKSLLSTNHSLANDLFPNSILVSTTHKASVVSTYQPSGNPTPISSVDRPSKPAVPPRSEARSHSMTSNYSRGRSRTAREREPAKDDPLASKRWRTIDDFIITPQEPSPIDKSAIATVANTASVTGKENARPTTSPTIQESAPLHLVTPKKNNHSPTKSISATRSRANSTTYSPFPKTGISPRSVARQPNLMSNDVFDSTPTSSSNDSTTDVSSQAKSNNAKARAGVTVNGPLEASWLKGAVDMNDSAHTKVSTHILPAVTHETIIPHVHNIREPQITREIHTHDIFHKIQPVVNVEVLPTKHYIKNSAGVLTEIPAPVLPIRSDDEQYEDSPRTSTSSSDSAVPPAIASNRMDRPSTVIQTSTLDRPTFTSTRTNSMLSNLPRISTTWRRPSTADTIQRTKFNKKRTASIASTINRYDGNSDPYYDDESGSSRSQRSEDSALLFRDTGYGGGFSAYGGGMLPGLMEPSPAANPAVAESEATKALRRKREEEELRRRLESLR